LTSAKETGILKKRRKNVVFNYCLSYSKYYRIFTHQFIGALAFIVSHGCFQTEFSNGYFVAFGNLDCCFDLFQRRCERSFKGVFAKSQNTPIIVAVDCGNAAYCYSGVLFCRMD